MLSSQRRNRLTSRTKGRKLKLETLELRQLMAADLGLDQAVFGPSQVADSASTSARGIRIINGTPTSGFPSVGIVGDTGGGFCSGTLISARHVLTAAHCTDGVTNTSGRVTFGSSTYSTNRVFVHPSYNEAQFGTDAANDIAIFQLTTDVVGITPSAIYRSTPTVGSLLTLVGYGGGGTGTTGSDGSFGTKRVGTTPIDAVSTTLIHWTFQGAAEANTAPGDSGGPAFLQINNEYVVAGVTSGGTLESAGYGDESYDTRVDAYQTWIDGIVSPAPTTNFIDYVTAGSTANQNFDSLANSGTADTLPSGWAIRESGTAANTTYAADDGAATSGNTFSYGTTATTDRALGSLLSGSLIPSFGAAIKNSTGAALTGMTVGYTGEQWRLGTANRADRLDFQYSLDATSLSDGTWVDANALDFSSPVTTGTLGKLNGNLAVNRTNISASIAGLNIATGATFWIRWVDTNASGADDGLAVDDFTFSATGSGGTTNSAPTISTNLGLSVLTNSTANVIATDDLNATDTQQSAAQLTYQATSLPSVGSLKLNGVAVVANTTTWTQADIDANKLTYDAPSAIGATGFAFSVSDGTLTTTGTFALTISAPGGSSNAIEYATLGGTYTQSFDSLTALGTSSQLPAGWYFSESGTGANTAYSAGAGNGTAGDTYSFGAASGTDRAFGTLRSGSVVSTVGAAIRNTSGSPITSITTGYTGEQWRLGTLGRTDQLDFQYSLDASSLTDGTWIDVDSLDFAAPQSTGAVGPLDGNASANRTALTGTISGLNVAGGNTIWIRWLDFSATGADDGLAIEDFTFTATGGTATNNAPTAVATSVSSLSIAENTPTTSAVKLADIAITDDGLGTNVLSLSGADAGFFSIVGNELFLNAGTTLSATTKPSYAVTINVDDAAVSETPDASTNFTLNVSAALQSQTITFPSLSNQTYGDEPVALNATASSGLSVTYVVISGPAGIVSNDLTITGAGTVVVEARQAGDSSFAAATAVQQSLVVAAKGLTIDNAIAVSRPFNGTTTASITGTLVGIVGSDVVTLSGGGTFADANVGTGKAVTAVLTLSGAAAPNYTLTQPVGLTADITKASQTITFGALENRTVGGAAFQLAAGSDSGLAISYTSSDPNVATVSGNIVTIVGLGTTTIVASQAGDSNYDAASDVSQSLTIVAASANVLTEDFANLTAGGDTATSGTGSPSSTEVTTNLTSNFTTSVKAYAAGGKVKLGTSSLAGSITSKPIDLSGNAGNFTVSFDVKGWTTLEGDILVSLNGGTPKVVPYTSLIADAYQTRSVVFSGGTSSSTIKIETSAKRAFLDNIVVSATGTVTNNAPTAVATNVPSLTIGDNTPTVAPVKVADITITDDGIGSNELSLSGADASFFSVVGSELYLKAGTTLSAATKPSYAVTINVDDVAVGATPDASTNFTLNLTASVQSQTISFPTLGNRTYGDAPLSLNATATSDLPVSYAIISGPASVASNSLTITGAGTVVVEARQAGNGSFSAASPVQRSFVVAPKLLTATATAVDKNYDGTTSAAVSITLQGLVAGDMLTGTASATFADALPGANKTVTVGPVTLVGSGKDNYTVGAVANVTASIFGNNAPTIAAQSFSINTKALSGSRVGTVIASDSDSGQSLSYSIPAGTAFGIHATTGVLTVIDASKLPIVKVATPMQIVVTVSDNGTPVQSSSATVTVNLVPNSGMAPLALSAPNLAVAENNKAGAKAGSVVPVAAYSGQKFQYAPLASTGDAANFVIDTSKGSLTVKPGVTLNREAKSSYTFDVQVLDSLDATKSTTAAVTVNVLDVNEAPVYALKDGVGNDVAITKGAASLRLDENVPGNATKNGLVIGRLTVADQDQPATSLKYQIDGKGSTIILDKTGAFGYDPSTGDLRIVDETKVSFESSKSIKLSFVVTDDPIAGDAKSKAISTKLTVTVSLNDVNEVPVISSPNTFSLAENNKAGAKVGTVKAKETDSKAAVKQILTYSIDSQKDALGADVAIFSIDSSKGSITVPTAGALNYEASATYTLIVRVSDNGTPGSFTLQTITVNVLDVNDSASLAIQDKNNVVTFAGLPQSLAGAANGTKVGRLSIADPDVGNAGSYSLSTLQSAMLSASKGALTLVEVAGSTSLWDIVIQDKSKLKVGLLNVKLTAQDGSAKPVKSTTVFSLSVTA